MTRSWVHRVRGTDSRSIHSAFISNTPIPAQHIKMITLMPEDAHRESKLDRGYAT